MAKPNEAAPAQKPEETKPETKPEPKPAVIVAKETVVAREGGTVVVPPRNVLKPAKSKDMVMGLSRERR